MGHTGDTENLLNFHRADSYVLVTQVLWKQHGYAASLSYAQHSSLLFILTTHVMAHERTREKAAAVRK